MGHSGQHNSNAQALRIYAYYHTLLSASLLLMFFSGIASEVLGAYRPELFLYTATSFLGLNSLSLLALWYFNFKTHQQQRFIIFFFDIIAIVLLDYSSSNNSGLAYLLIVTIASAGMQLRSILAILLAALATILTLASAFISWQQGSDSIGRDAFAAGSLGALLFITAISFYFISERLKASNELAISQARHAAHLQKLAQTIIERMRTGIMVVNENDQVTFVNNSAKELLNLNHKEPLNNAQQQPELYEQLRLWRAFHHSQSPVVQGVSSDQEVKMSFAELTPDSNEETLIFLEDNRAITQKAQQLKLASLGRLTASIAHEIRNPLGAISHASQLLSESDQLPEHDIKLTHIIDRHSKRVNQIIENVLQLSRRKASEPITIPLYQWLAEFINEYQQEQPKAGTIHLNCHLKQSDIKFDPSQLRQLIGNIVDNGLRYSEQATGERRIELEINKDPISGAVQLDIIDLGKALDEEAQKHIFEPFYTTENTGTGLGLFICQELSEANQARLSYLSSDTGSSCFRIRFAHRLRAFQNDE